MGLEQRKLVMIFIASVTWILVMVSTLLGGLLLNDPILLSFGIGSSASAVITFVITRDMTRIMLERLVNRVTGMEDEMNEMMEEANDG